MALIVTDVVAMHHKVIKDRKRGFDCYFQKFLCGILVKKHHEFVGAIQQ